MDERSIKSQRLDFLDELSSLREITKDIGKEHPCYEKLVNSIDYLFQFRYVFFYAEYIDDCNQKTPNFVRSMIGNTFNHTDVKQFCKSVK